MNQTSAGLRDLHRLHTELSGVVEEIERGPRQIAARQQLITRKKAEVDDRKQKLKQLRAGADQKNLQLKSCEAKILDHKSKLNIASNNREYDILLKSIEADTVAKSVLEDEIIEALEQIDTAQGEVQKAEQEVVRVEKELVVFADEVKAREPGLLERRAALEGKLAVAEKFLPSEHTLVYRRLVNAHGADALSPVVNRACTSCNVQLTMQQHVELRSGKVMFCRNCHRLLYIPEDEA